MHQTLINEKHYIKIKIEIRQLTKEGRGRRGRESSILIRPAACAEMNLWKHAKSRFVCDANVNMSCALQDGGWLNI